MNQTFRLSSVAMEHAGQFMIPAELAAAKAKRAEGLIEPSELRKAEDACIRRIVEQQREIGIKTITDGELRRDSWDIDFLTGLRGVERTIVSSGHIWQDVELGTIVPEITGSIAYNDAHPMFEDCEFLASLLTKGETLRVTLPSPAHLLMWIITNANIAVDPALIAEQLAEACNATLLKLYSIGCRSIIMRDTSWNTFCDRDKLKRLLLHGIDPEKVLPLLRVTNDNATKGLPADFERILFVKARCAESSRHSVEMYRRLIEDILRHSNFDAFMADYDSVESMAINAAVKFPSDKGLVLGVVAHDNPRIETYEEVASKVREAVQAITPRWLRLSPADGFQQSKNLIDTSAFTEADQWHKLEALKAYSERLAEENA